MKEKQDNNQLHEAIESITHPQCEISRRAVLQGAAVLGAAAIGGMALNLANPADAEADRKSVV